MKPEQIKELVDLVKAMRKAQKNYFQYRKTVDLAASKAAEAKVDKALEDLTSNQISMF